MEAVVENLTKYLKENEVLFVFPSEVVASFWREKSLLIGGIKAVRSDRFLSWDRFKERLFFLTREKKPVNNIHRLFFAASLAHENKEAEEPVFTSIIHPKFRRFSSRYVDSIISALPGLKTIIEKASGSGKVLGPELKRDLQLLWNRYNHFLDENELFEPEYEEFFLAELKARAFLFYPEIIQDFSRFVSQLRTLTSLTLISLDGAEDRETRPSRPHILFDNPLQEVKYVLSSIERLLHSGEPADSIGITIADTDTLPFLLEEAVLRDIPLQVRHGEALTGYPAGSLFLQLKETAGSDYSFETLKNLLMNHRFPWKTSLYGKELILFGIRQFCMKGKQEWKQRLAAYGSPMLSDFFTNLTRSMDAVTGASSFAGVKQAFFRFIAIFFNDDFWEPEDEKVFQTCINVLNELIETEAALPGISVQNPFALFVKVLSSRVYVSRERGGGIPVFPYRVSAGTGLPHHFLMGISENTVRVFQSGFPYLREDQKQALGLKEADFTDAFLRGYSCSGEKVIFSGSSEGVNDTHRVPSFFLRRDGSESPPALKDDLYALENGMWKGKNNSPGNLYRIQKEGFRRAFETGLTVKQEDYTRQVIGQPDLVQSLADLQKEEKTGLIRISPTRLEGFARCPFRYLVSSVLGILKEDFDFSTEEPRREGILFHQIVTDLFESIKGEGGIFDPVRRDDYQQRLKECIEKSFRRWNEKGGLFILPVLAGKRRKATDLLTAFLKEEAKVFPGYEILHCEHDLALPLEALPVCLSGRIDRISRNEEGCLLLDYKKRNRITRRDLLGDEPSSYQMPFYTILAEGAGMDIAHVSYYDFEKKKYDHVLRPEAGGSWVDREGMTGLVSRTLEKVTEMAEAVAKGSYTCTRDSDKCSPCEYRIVCRERYVLR